MVSGEVISGTKYSSEGNGVVVLVQSLSDLKTTGPVREEEVVKGKSVPSARYGPGTVTQGLGMPITLATSTDVYYERLDNGGNALFRLDCKKGEGCESTGNPSHLPQFTTLAYADLKYSKQGKEPSKEEPLPLGNVGSLPTRILMSNKEVGEASTSEENPRTGTSSEGSRKEIRIPCYSPIGCFIAREIQLAKDILNVPALALTGEPYHTPTIFVLTPPPAKNSENMPQQTSHVPLGNSGSDR
jgi:hypothetical protein